MLSPIQKIKDKLQGKGVKSEIADEDIIDVHDLLMVEYGWIPLKEFRELPLVTVSNLISCITRRKERERKEIEKNKPRRR